MNAVLPPKKSKEQLKRERIAAEAQRKKDEELNKLKSAKQKIEQAAAARALETAKLLPKTLDKAFFETLESEAATSVLFDLSTVSEKVQET